MKRMHTLIRPDVLQQMKQNRFTGRLTMEWYDGEVEYFKLSSTPQYRKHKRWDDRDFEIDFF